MAIFLVNWSQYGKGKHTAMSEFLINLKIGLHGSYLSTSNKHRFDFPFCNLIKDI